MLHLNLVEVEMYNGETMNAVLHRNNLLEALESFNYLDNDFSGVNGDEYLWDFAKDLGYKSNCEYVLAMLKNEKEYPTDEDVVATFFRRWLGNNEYRVSTITDSKNRVTSIALAVIF